MSHTPEPSQEQRDREAMELIALLDELEPGGWIPNRKLDLVREALSAAEARGASREHDLYYELLFAVENKWEGETRHQTALRYIREREQRVGRPSMEAGKDRQLPGTGEEGT